MMFLFPNKKWVASLIVRIGGARSDRIKSNHWPITKPLSSKIMRREDIEAVMARHVEWCMGWVLR